MNAVPINVSTDTQPPRTVMGMGKTNIVCNLIPAYEQLRNGGARFITGLSIGYMGALVAAGEFSAVLFGGKDPHDMAAIKLLVEEAGGTVTDLYGKNNERQDLSMQGMLATNGMVHAEILTILKNTR